MWLTFDPAMVGYLRPGRGRTVMSYEQPLRERAAEALWWQMCAHRNDLLFPGLWPKEPPGADALEVYGFLRALEWLSIALPTKTCRGDITDLKWLIEHAKFLGERYPLDDPEYAACQGGEGVYAATDICNLAVFASGIVWDWWRGRKGHVVFRATWPRTRKWGWAKRTETVGCYPGCLGL